MKFPYGRRDFYELITEEYIYIDRTHHIRFIEEWGKELLLLRPRRFGKSLWLSTLMNYYDVEKTDQFERLFGHLAIGQNPTPLHNQYLVMRWDFSTVQSHGSIEQIEAALHDHINARIRNFQGTYYSLLGDADVVQADNALYSFDLLLGLIRASGHKLYLFIDEYDNFANEILMNAHGNNEQRYTEFVKGEGVFKTLFKNIKSAASGNGLDRVYMTGVSPIVMNDATSGANVNEDIYWFKELNDLCGFRQDEVATLVAELASEQDFSPEKEREAMELMRVFYDGSWFTTETVPPEKAESAESITSRLSTSSYIYNPTLVFYFLRHWQRTGEYPPNMLDRNLQMDSNKLAYIGRYDRGQSLLVAALSDMPVDVFEIGTDFGVSEMWQPDMQEQRLASLLCYLGTLTVDGRKSDGKTSLRIPNLVIRKLYAERVLKTVFPEATQQDKGQDAAQMLFAQGNIQPLCEFVEENLLAIYANRDYLHFNELTLKTLFMSLLYHNHLYIMDSEPAIQRRYGDLSMIIRPRMRHHTVFDLLFEFKYVPLKAEKKIEETGRAEENVDKKGSARTDGNRPLTGEKVKQMSQTELVALDVVQSKLADARSQLQDYTQTLQQKYGADLKLRSYAVVAVGFERLIWEEVN